MFKFYFFILFLNSILILISMLEFYALFKCSIYMFELFIKHKILRQKFYKNINFPIEIKNSI